MNIFKLFIGVYYFYNLLWKKMVWDIERKDVEECDMKFEMDWLMLYMWCLLYLSIYRSILYVIWFVKLDCDYVFM